MQATEVRFSTSSTTFYFEAAFSDLPNLVPQANAVLVTDATVYDAHQVKFAGWKTIVIEAGEAFKVQATVDSIIEKLLAYGADRTTTLIGVGGGVVTDITGYAASIYMRGIPFGFVPTTVLAMVDAAIGGKNGIDVGDYKNMVGTITQPRFLLYDMDFLKTLPDKEWRNGFAEIIKHAAIKNEAMFSRLQKASLQHFQNAIPELQNLIQENVMLKAGVVQQDEFERADRRLLNYGHTLAHAIEKKYSLMHGEAVAIGMVFAAELSRKTWGFEKVDAVQKLVKQYGLPININFDKEEAFAVLQRDKKKEGAFVHFVLLHAIGKAAVQKIPLSTLKELL